MIQSFSARLFKAHRASDLDLSPFTVIVGPNASGKTTILEAIPYFSQLATTQPSALFQGRRSLSRLRSTGSTGALELKAAGSTRGTTWTASYEATPELGSTDEHSRWRHKMTGTWDTGKVSADEDASFPNALGANFLSAVLLHLDVRALAAPSYSDDPVPRVEYDGEVLASVLATLKLGDEDSFNKIVEGLQEIVPSVKRVRIERAAIRRTKSRVVSLDEQEKASIPDTQTLWGHRIVFDMQGASGLSAEDVGEGPMLALGLLTVLIGPRHPRLVLLDDIELALHPAAQEHLVRVLRALQSQDPELQIVTTSHSPFILNLVEPSEVRLAVLRPDGSAICGKLEQHPQFERWKGAMQPGELWSTFGEEWLLGQQPHE